MWIVWNTHKTEGFVTQDYQVAYEARKGADTNCYSEDGERSDLAVAFCERWSHAEDCSMEEFPLGPSVLHAFSRGIVQVHGKAVSIEHLEELIKPEQLT